MPTPPARPGHVSVLGAGLQGTCAALALRRAGWSVTLVDRAPEPLLGASLHGEGKVHLGFVYGNEPDRSTASLMVEGATSFRRLLDEWTGGDISWAPLRSEPFSYAVLPDSLVEPDALEAHYAWVADQLSAAVAAGEDYLGLRPDCWVERLRQPRVRGVAGELSAAFRTAEVAVEMRRLRPTLVRALARSAVSWRPETAIDAVQRTGAGFLVEGRHGGAEVSWPADVVVNCLWDGRLAVDASLDLVPSRPWVFRLKRCVEGRLPEGAAVSSVTFALGPFGDVVVRSDGAVYASWYPAALAGWSDALAPPDSWRQPLDQARVELEAARLLEGFAPLVPALRGLTDRQLGGGVIFAWGADDIHDPTSELHSRSRVGVHAHDGYFSIDTGKLTVAPLFAGRLLEVL
ncbi:MAG: FAD-dependent oxidoreductase [Acidimicrobiales bacterium]